MMLSLVIPCYNEARSLPALVARCAEVFTRADIEVILVDNGSTDDTPAVMAAVLAGLPPGSPVRTLRVVPNRGYGGGIMAGLDAARGRIVAWTHADLQTDVADVLRGLALFEAAGTDALFVKGRRYGRPPGDVAFTIGMSAFETLLFARPLWDINAQPTMLPRSAYAAWVGAPTDFALDLFAYHAARGAGLRVRRLPVRFGARLHGVSSWNVDWRAKRKFIARTIAFSLALRKGRHLSAGNTKAPA